MPGGFVCSGSMKATLDDYRVKETFAGSRPLSKLLTSEQRRFFTDHAPEGVALDDLARLGPINVLKLKFTPGDFARRLVAELWFYPDAHAPARAVDEVRAERRLPGRRRTEGVPVQSGHRPQRRAGDEDAAWRWTTSPASSRPPLHDADRSRGDRILVDERADAVPSNQKGEPMTTAVTTPAADDQVSALAQPAERRGVPAPRRRPRGRAERRRGHRATRAVRGEQARRGGAGTGVEGVPAPVQAT